MDRKFNGRIRPTKSCKALRFGSYFRELLASPPPASVDYSPKAMAALSLIDDNDRWGDCVIACMYHAVGVWTGNESGTAVVGNDAEVLNEYHSICGPGDPGCEITAVLDYLKVHGLPFNGVIHKIEDYVSVDWTNRQEVMAAVYLFGALPIGINLPQAWTTAKVWDVTNTPIVGGHCVVIVGYNAQGVIIASWGQLFLITWAAFLSRNWVEEAYAPLSPDSYANGGVAFCGVDVTGLRADLATIRAGGVPSVGPTPPPVPVPTPPIPPNPPPVPPKPIPVPVPTPPPVPVPVVPCGLDFNDTCHVVNVAINSFNNWNPAYLRMHLYNYITGALSQAWPGGAK